MRQYKNVIAAYSVMLVLIFLVGIFQSWSIALSILNYCLISAVMTIGANIQWGYAGLINFGIMGYTALGGLAVVLISVAPVPEAWNAGGFNLIICLIIIILTIVSSVANERHCSGSSSLVSFLTLLDVEASSVGNDS